MTRDQAEHVKREFLRRGLDHVLPVGLPIVHPVHGCEWVMPGYCFDGDSGVPDWCLEASCEHDHNYQSGTVNGWDITRHWADGRYRSGYVNRGMRILGHIRYVGLRLLGWRAWNRYRKLDGADTIRKNTLPDAVNWSFPNRSWMLRDAVYNGGVE